MTETWDLNPTPKPKTLTQNLNWFLKPILKVKQETDNDQANMEIEDDTLTPTSDHQEDEEENQKIKELFLKSLQDYGAKVANLNDKNIELC